MYMKSTLLSLYHRHAHKPHVKLWPPELALQQFEKQFSTRETNLRSSQSILSRTL